MLVGLKEWTTGLEPVWIEKLIKMFCIKFLPNKKKIS